MFCKKCGCENSGKTNFCVKCGNKLEKTIDVSHSDNSAAISTYSEFGTGAKIWFGICGIANIITGLVGIVNSIILMSNGMPFFRSLISVLIASLGAGVGIDYIALLLTRQKKYTGSLFIALIATLFLNIINIIFVTGDFITLITAIISSAIHIGILYAVLSKYDDDNKTVPNADVNVLNTNHTPENSYATGAICCPKCGGNHLQAVNESKTTGGGFSASNGCCGYILLGPLGILCGACGSKAKTTNKTFFVCMDCGNKFAN